VDEDLLFLTHTHTGSDFVFQHFTALYYTELTAKTVFYTVISSISSLVL